MIPIFLANGICNTHTIGIGRMRRYRSVKQEHDDSAMVTIWAYGQFTVTVLSHQDWPERGRNKMRLVAKMAVQYNEVKAMPKYVNQRKVRLGRKMCRYSKNRESLIARMLGEYIISIATNN